MHKSKNRDAGIWRIPAYTLQYTTNRTVSNRQVVCRPVEIRFYLHSKTLNPCNQHLSPPQSLCFESRNNRIQCNAFSATTVASIMIDLRTI
jgi:hypothetical protein